MYYGVLFNVFVFENYNAKTSDKCVIRNHTVQDNTSF